MKKRDKPDPWTFPAPRISGIDPAKLGPYTLAVHEIAYQKALTLQAVDLAANPRFVEEMQRQTDLMMQDMLRQQQAAMASNLIGIGTTAREQQAQRSLTSAELQRMIGELAAAHGLSPRHPITAASGREPITELAERDVTKAVRTLLAAGRLAGAEAGNAIAVYQLDAHWWVLGDNHDDFVRGGCMTYQARPEWKIRQGHVPKHLASGIAANQHFGPPILSIDE